MNKHQEEYIGKKIVIEKSNNKHQEGLSGIIIDKTKNTFKIRQRLEQGVQKTVVILKKDKEFIINNKKIKGNTITKRPEERIKIKEK